MASKYTREDRYRAATAMVTSGNSMVASSQTGIPASTIRHWYRNDADSQSICQEVWADFGDEIKSNLAQIVREAGDQSLDRLKNGDFVRDTKTGELARVPIKGKDAAIIGAVAFDKLRIAENQPTNIVRHEDTRQQLDRLADHFIELSRRNRIDDANP